MAAAIAHGLRMAVNLLIVKMIAVYVGPAGMGVLGQFMSLATMVSVFAGGGIGNGISKYVAEYKNRPRRMLRFLGAAAVYGLCFSALIMLVCVIGAARLSRALFGDDGYAWLFPCLGAAHFLCFLGTGVIAFVNGQHRADLFAGITITGYLGALPIAYLLISQLGMEGAALALLLGIACTGLPAIWLIARSRLTPLVRMSLDKTDARNLVHFTVMLLASATLFPLAEIWIRTHIIQVLGAEVAGLWQASARLSGAYLGFFTVFLATSYMPRLSGLTDKAAILRMVYRHLALIGLLFGGFAGMVYAARDFVIPLLFSSAFDGMASFMGWQLLGDLFRVCSYVIGFLGVAKAAVKLYIAAEFLQAGLYAALSSAVLQNGGQLQEVMQAYALTYLIYLCVTVVCLLIYRRRAR